MAAIASPDILHVDLTGETILRRMLPPSLRDADLGGRGLAGALLDADPRLAWDAPEAAVVFAPGRLAGLDLPGVGHFHAAFRSPRTGGVARAGAGGRLAGALAGAGLAAVVVTGRARRPTGVAIRDGEARLVDATPLWGQPTDAIFAALGAHDGAAAIGPAAVAGSPLATLVADRWHGAGRAGLGPVLAAKRLLYLAATGHGPVPVADPAALAGARAAMERLVAAAPALSGPCGFGRFGPAALVDLTGGRRMQPTRHFRQTFFERAGSVNAPALEAAFGAHGVACPGCPVGCRRVAPDGRALPDADALSHLTALLGLSDPELAVGANAFCLGAGLDPAGAAAAVSARAARSGEELSPARVMELLAAMAAADDPGRPAGRDAGELAVKGLELPAFDPRGACGLALALAVSPDGPDPWAGGCLSHEILRKPVATDRFTFEGKARAVFLGENAVAAAACLGGCPFFSLAVSLEEWALALAAVTGRPATAGDLARLGERTVFRERLQNARFGLGAAADDLPGLFFTEPGSSGDAVAVPPLSRAAFLEARAKYYRLRGLDAGGLPAPERAAALELPWTS